MKIIQLAESFYRAHQQHTEILQKGNRPYVMVVVSVRGTSFAIPFRSHIRHPYALWTDRPNGCGLDFTKSVVIDPATDVAAVGVQIRQNEYEAIKGREAFITKKFVSFLRTYRKAYQKQEIPRNRMLIQNSALQYFIREVFDCE